MRFSTLLLAAVILPLAACQKPAPAEPAKPAEPTVTTTAPVPAATPVHDVSSYAEPEKVVVKHLSLDLAVDFAKKVLAGSATFDLDWKDPAARNLALDTRGRRCSSPLPPRTRSTAASSTSPCRCR